MTLFETFFGKVAAPSPHDWHGTGEKRWFTLKEGGGYKRQVLQAKEVDLNGIAEPRWMDEYYIADWYSGGTDRIKRIVPASESDEFAGIPAFGEGREA